MQQLKQLDHQTKANLAARDSEEQMTVQRRQRERMLREGDLRMNREFKGSDSIQQQILREE